MSKKKNKSIKIQASIKFDKKIAKSFSKMTYAKAQSINLKHYTYLEEEKLRLGTPRLEQITELLEYYRELGFTKYSSTALVLQGIYKKNKEGALKEKHITNSNLLSILTKPETLLLAYREIKGNKGAMTKSATASISKEDFNNLTDSQKILYEKSFTFPDGINIHTIRLACRLLSKNKYPWGTSLRIYIDKPGQQKKKKTPYNTPLHG